MADPGESQASENQAQVNLVELFLAGEAGIERRRYIHIFAHANYLDYVHV